MNFFTVTLTHRGYLLGISSDFSNLSLQQIPKKVVKSDLSLQRAAQSLRDRRISKVRNRATDQTSVISCPLSGHPAERRPQSAKCPKYPPRHLDSWPENKPPAPHYRRSHGIGRRPEKPTKIHIFGTQHVSFAMQLLSPRNIGHRTRYILGSDPSCCTIDPERHSASQHFGQRREPKPGLGRCSPHHNSGVNHRHTKPVGRSSPHLALAVELTAGIGRTCVHARRHTHLIDHPITPQCGNRADMNHQRRMFGLLRSHTYIMCHGHILAHQILGRSSSDLDTGRTMKYYINPTRREQIAHIMYRFEILFNHLNVREREAIAT